MKKVGEPWMSKALYYRQNFVDDAGNKKSKWIKVEGVTVADNGSTLEINTPLKEGWGNKNRVNWELREREVIYHGKTEYDKVKVK